MRDLQRSAAESASDSLILTYENLQHVRRWQLLPRRLGAIAAATGFTLKVAVLIRPQHLAINSAYTQSVRTLRTAETFSAFVDRTRRDRRYRLPGYYRQWSGPTGAAFHPIPFTETELAPDLVTRFFAEFGLGGDRLAGIPPPSRVHNTGPGPMTVELMRRLAAYGGARLPRPLRYKLRIEALKLAQQAGWNAERFNGVTNETRDALERQFGAENQEFAMQCWRRPWREIFHADYERPFISNELATSPAHGKDDELESAVDDVAGALGIKLDR